MKRTVALYLYILHSKGGKAITGHDNICGIRHSSFSLMTPCSFYFKHPYWSFGILCSENCNTILCIESFVQFKHCFPMQVAYRNSRSQSREFSSQPESWLPWVQWEEIPGKGLENEVIVDMVIIIIQFSEDKMKQEILW